MKEFFISFSTLYIENLGTISLTIAVLTAVYYSVKLTFSKREAPDKDGTNFLAVIAKVAAIYSLPIAPALVIGAFSNELLAKIEGVQIPLIVAALAIVFTTVQSFKN